MIYSTAITSSPERPWVIFIHGFTANHALFNRQQLYFQERYNILLVDLRGHGKSSGMDGPYGREEYTDDIEEIINENETEQFFLWGTHTGAAIALIYALRHPGKVRGLILEGTPLPGFPMPRLAEIVRRAEKMAAEEGLKTAMNDWFENADWFAYMREHPDVCRADEQQKMLAEFEGRPLVFMEKPRDTTDVNARLKELDLPVLMYNGQEDLEEFLLVSAHMETEISGSKRVLIPNAGGFPCWENPEEVNRVVEAFLRSH